MHALPGFGLIPVAANDSFIIPCLNIPASLKQLMDGVPMSPWRKLKSLLARSDASTSKQSTPQERRLTIRKVLRLTPAFIWSDRMAFPKECRVRNFSNMGARIDLCHDTVKVHTLANSFTLYLPAEKREIDCQLVWLAGRNLGLRFSGAYRAPTRRYGA